jgi:YidC/Oxa1 family membrane protein insertase
VLEPIYWAISWILLQWHALWNLAFRGSEFLATNWDWVLAIVFLVLTIRGILFPVFVKQIKSQRAMQALAPQIKALQEKHKGDRETLQREMMELYRKEKANPLMGCLPMVVQLPVFWSLFHVLRHLKPTMPEHLKTLYGWTVGQFDSASGAKLFGAPIAASFKSSAADLATMGANGTTVKIVAGVLVAIMIATTYMTSRQMILKTGWSEDPQQRMIQRLMLYGIPVSLLISGTVFPIGVVIYWVTTNLFSLGQQFWVLRKYPPPPTPTKSTTTGKAGTTAGAGSGASSLIDMILGRKPKDTPGPKTATSRTAASKNAASKAATSKNAAPKKAAPKNGASPADGKALAPKPGAKPINPKKGNASKARRSG